MDLTQFRAALNDNALRERLYLAALSRGVESPEAWVNARVGKLLTASLPTNAASQTIADLHAYGAGQKVEQETARAAYLAKAPAVKDASDPVYVNDNMLVEAVETVLKAEAPSTTA